MTAKQDMIQDLLNSVSETVTHPEADYNAALDRIEDNLDQFTSEEIDELLAWGKELENIWQS